MTANNPVSGNNLEFDPILAPVLEEVRQYLAKFARNSEFLSKMRSLFGESFTDETALSLAEAWQNRNFNVIGAIQFLSSSELNGANGAYASATDTIYLSREFVEKQDINAIVSVLLEEIGHRIDRLLNTEDSAGDEGAIFSALVRGETLSAEQLQQLKAENDIGIINLSGQTIQVEKQETANIQSPNLTITNVTAPTTANSGQSINFSWTVKNDSSATTESSYWYDTVVFSKNQTFGDSDDVYIASEFIDNINYNLPLYPDTNYTVNNSVVLPVQAVGSGYLLFKTDDGNLQGETNEADNVYVHAIDIAIPNLVITNVTAPTIANSGQNISLSWTVKNDSSSVTTGSPYWYDTIVFSKNQIFGDSDDVYIANEIIDNINYNLPLYPDTNYTVNSSVILPVQAGGSGYLLFKTDDGNLQGETNDADNVYVHTIDIAAPNLTISTAAAPNAAILGDSISVSWTVLNNSSTISADADWYDTVFLSNDQILDSADLYLASFLQSEKTPLAAGTSYTDTKNITIGGDLIGDRYLIFVTDYYTNFIYSYNLQGETDETDNTYILPINLSAPDLIVSDATAPVSGALGETVSLSWTVKNQGTVKAPANWSDYIYWSSDNIFDFSDTYITVISASQTPVSAGGSYTQTQNITLPNQTNFFGNGYLIFRANGSQQQGETDSNNNDRAVAFRIDAPDLIVSNASAPELATVGATVNISWDVKNQGTGAANADWYDSVYISNDPIFDNSDLFLTNYWAGSNSPLVANGTYTVTQNISLPSTATGDRYLLFVTDRYYFDSVFFNHNNNLQGETDETNNVRAVAINISASDLQVTATNAPTAAVLGETVELTWTVTNQGTGEAPRDWYDYIYLSSNQTLDSSDIIVADEIISTQTPLAAGASYTVSKNVVLPSFTPGNQYLLFVADRNNEQGEINEDNNVKAVAISLSAPDLIVSNAFAPATGILGKSVEVSWTVQNQSTTTASADWYDYVYLSNDTVFDANVDTLVAQESISTQTPLTAGGNYTVTRNINLPNFATGDRYLIFVADGSQNQVETNNSNNTRAVAINLNAPDLVVSNIIAPVEALSGQQIEVIWTVTNQGNSDATGTWTDYVYLSEDSTTTAERFLEAFSFTGTIAVGQSIERRQLVTVPIDLSGNRRIVVNTNADRQLLEAINNEANNTIADDRAIDVRLSPFPNLQVSSVTAPPTAFSRQQAVIEWTVTNTGNGATNAPNWQDYVWLSLDNILDNSDIFLGSAANISYLNVGESYINSLNVTLPRESAGNYRFLVQTDRGNQVFEYDRENDNLGTSGITDIAPSPLPDLQVTSVNAPTQAFSGQTMALTYTITNNGEGIVPIGEDEWYEYIYMSEDAILDANDRLVGSFYRDTWIVSRIYYYDLNGNLLSSTYVFDQPEYRPLPGQNYTVTQNVNLPVGVSGDFFFFVQFDARNQVYEGAFESNNTGYDPIATRVNLTPPPDLEVEIVDVPAEALASHELTINYRVTNFGATATPNFSWKDSFYLSTDNQLNIDTDLSLGERFHYGVLQAGESYDESATFTLLNGIEGNYYVFVVSDRDNNVFELNNNNNSNFGANAVVISSRPADLIVPTATAPANAEAGKAIRVNWTVSNQGTGDTAIENWTDKIFASVDGVLDSNDILLESFNRSGLLNPNNSYSRSELVTIPFTLTGNYNLFVVTDADGKVYEATNENNNSSQALPVTVTRQMPNLQVTQINFPITAQSGASFTVNWTVQNFGVGQTNADYWYDNIYLSSDPVLSSNDIKLGQVFHSGILEPSAQYQASSTFTLPIDLAGQFYAIVRTDSTNQIIEGSLENDNDLVTSNTTTVNLSAVPDLVVQSINAPATAISSQLFSLTWTVRNNGADTGKLAWYDSFYLSRDQIFDRISDKFLGYQYHEEGLAAGESYTQTQSFQIPRGLSGPYYVFAVTDSGNSIYERGGELNNSGYDGNSMQINLAPPADLVVSNITVPANGVPGQNIAIGYTVINQGSNAALGSWVDSIYLSADNQWDANDPLVGQVYHFGDVASGTSYSETLTAPLPGVVAGNYHVIVRSDIRNQIPESSEVNNAGSSQNQIVLDVERLELDVPKTGNLGQNQSVYYRVEVGAGETLRVKFDSQSTSATNELYIRYGEMPTRSNFDIGFSEAFLPDQEVIVPSTKAGTYYILAYGDNNYLAPEYTIKAEVLDFSILGIGTNHGSNLGQVTTTISGAKFTPNSIVKLVSANGSEQSAAKIWWKSSTELWATFDLQGLGTGLYDIKVEENGRAAILNDSFTINNRSVGKVEVSLNTPSAIRAGQIGIVTIAYENIGETDVIAPIIQLIAENAELSQSVETGFGGSAIEVLGISPEGPAGILAPGETGYFNFRFRSTQNAGASIKFGVSALETSNDPIDLAGIKDSSRPEGIDPNAWDAIWQNFSNGIGTNVRSYLEALADNATHLSLLEQRTSNTRQLLGFEFQQASNTLIGSTLVTTVDCVDAAPGLSLVFSRNFNQALVDRYELGALGRGWSHSWDISLATNATNDVTIHIGAGKRSFTQQQDGSYVGLLGDRATLSLEGGAYHLQEQDGSTTVFRLDGRLDYLQDKNKNRITASYTGSRLTSLTHANGDSLSLAYNGQGRISQITDSTGRATTYSYDASGEHLLSVTSPEGTTGYAYETGKGAALEHSLKSITYSDGTQRLFSYDNQGRLIQESRNDGIEAITYQYDSSGGIRAIDSRGESVQTLLNDAGITSQNIDALGRTFQTVVNLQNNSVSLIVPDGSTYTYNYDANGNLNIQTNPLGQQISFTYEPTFNQLQTVRDARNNALNYTYDTKSNLTAITYADESREQFSYDAAGNVNRYTNRRGQSIDYTYNNDGLVTSKNFSNGSSITYGYDARGNLTSTTDASGTTTLSYDNANQLTRIDYPDGRFLEYSHDSSGRRSRMKDGDGFAVNYLYGSNGRLEQLTNINNELVVRYEYDSLGHLLKETKGNGTYSIYEYDTAGQLTHLIHYNSGGGINSRFDYTYDVRGLVTSTTTLDGTTNYEYDAIGQLTGVTLPNGRTIQYRYDAAGNRIAISDGGSTTNYSANNLNQYTQVGNATYAYDADGNLISKTENGQIWTYSYNAENRLIRVETLGSTWEYEYNAFGARTAKVYNGQRTEYLVDPTGLGDVIGEYSGNTNSKYIHGIGLESQIQGGSTAYFDFDAIGSTSGLTGIAGNYINSYSYLPFGESLNKSEVLSNSFEYVGQWGIAEEGNGLSFMRARYYDLNTGHFMQADPINVLGGFNLYNYAENNPTLYIDPSGLICIGEVILGVSNLLGGSAGSAIAATETIAAVATAATPPAWGATVLLGLKAGLDIPESLYQIAAGIAQVTGGLAGKSVSRRGITGELLPDVSNRIGGQQAKEFASNVNKARAVYDVTQIVRKFGKEKAQEILTAFFKGLGILDKAEIDCEEDDFPKKPKPQKEAETRIVRATDPNDIVGPAGFGEENWIPSSALLPYTIRFENKADATAPAQQVTITQQLDRDLDWRTFRLGSFGWGDLTFEALANTAFYQERLDLREKLGFFVDVVAGIDIAKGEAFWTLTTIDPETGEIPTNPLIGFLPPDNQTTENPDGGVGDGFVNYTIKAKREIETGTVIDAKATIIFDTEEPLDTPPIFNTLDAGKPTSSVTALPVTATAEEFLIKWSGGDDPNGSAIANFTIYVSDNGAPFTPWLENTKLTEATYIGQPGHTYTFYSVARDNAGNIESAPATPDAQITVPGVAVNPGVLAFSANEFSVNEDGTIILEVTVNRINGSDGEVSATIALTDGSAKSPTDYNNTPIVVTFANNETTKKVTISIVNDTLVEITETLSLTLKDPTGGATIGAQNTATLTVVDNDVNNPPTLNTINKSGNEDTAIAFTATDFTNAFSDTNEDSLIKLQITSLPSNGILKLNGIDVNISQEITVNELNNLTFTPDANFNGTVSFGWNGFDGTVYAVNAATVNLTINSANDAPTVQNAIADRNATEDSPFSFTIPANAFSDVDGDTLSYLATLDNGNALPSWLNFNGTTFSGTPTNSNVGAIDVKVTATDGSNASVSDTFRLTVANVNDAPVAQNDTATTDKNIQLVISDSTLLANDNDIDVGDSLAVINVSNATNGTVVLNNNTITFDPTTDFVGNASFDYTIRDSQGATSTAKVAIAVQQTTVNQPPNAQENKTVTIAEDAAPVALNISAPIDPNNDPLTITVNTVPTTGKGEVRLSNGTVVTAGTNLTVSELTSLVFAPSLNANGNAGTFSYTVSDGNGGSDSQTVTLAITPVNDKPILKQTIPDRTAIEARAFKYTFSTNTFADIDVGDKLTYTAKLSNGNPLPTWLTFNPSTRTFSGTPAESDVGILQIQVKATDLAGASVSDIFNLTVNHYDRYISGNGEDNILEGKTGNDTLDGGAGKDKMIGGKGNDTYIVDNPGDTIVENPNEGTDTVRSSVTHTLAANVENLVLLGTNNLNGKGNTSSNRLTGNSGDNQLTGYAGNDTINGAAGKDKMIGGTGNDTYVVDNPGDTIVENPNEGTDTVESYIDYTLGNNLENLRLLGSANLNGTGNALNNSLIGNSGNNKLVGGAGNDALNGGTGNDILEGGTGNDSYTVDSLLDVVTENFNEGIDTVNASFSYTLGANVENLSLFGSGNINGTGNDLDNRLSGNGKNNTLTGGLGKDTLTGNDGNDLLTGGLGNDTLTGGQGLDRFRFYALNEGIDRIIDFVAVDDSILISASGFGGGLVAGTIAETQFVLGTAALEGGDRVIYNQSTGALFFDADGTGSNAQIQFATLTTKPAIDFNDIVVI